MYSYEDRIRAVELYIKLGKRAAATICQLGYPTRKALRSWHADYERSLDLPLGYVRSRPRYSQAQKEQAVEHYLEHGRCIAFTVKVLGYPARCSLRAWIGDLKPELSTPVVARSNSRARAPSVKQAAVIALCTREEPAQAVARQLGVSRPTLYNWKDQLLGPEAPASMKRREEPSLSPPREELERQLESLRRDVRRLQLEQEILKRANELLKKETGIDRNVLSNRAKMQLVDALRHSYPLSELLEALGLAKSSYFYHRSREKAGEKYAEARRTMADIFERNHRCYGYRRMRAALSRQCLRLSEKVVQRLMKQECLVVPKPKRRRFGSYLGEISPAPENLIDRDFSAAAPNEKWLTDITEFQIAAGKVYLSPMIDCFDGQVVSWSIGTSPDAELVNTMLDAAVETLSGDSALPVVHSDRGAHYRWPGWLTRIARARLTRSMSRKGCSPDNAACEGFFGRLKTELFYPRDWRTASIEEFIEELDSYIRWYNEERIKISLGAQSPIEYRRSLGIAA